MLLAVEGEVLRILGNTSKVSCPDDSTMKVRKLLSSRCKGFLASIVDLSKETELTPEDFPVARDYVSVFSKDFPGLPLDREIVFSIELMLGTAPIS